jgi:four helix bundle protein
MTSGERGDKYDLEDRTLAFARRVRSFVKRLPRNIAAAEDGKQLIRSSGSVGANYIEANESLSKKDFALRIKICRKESKESRYWLELLCDDCQEGLESECRELSQEARELMNIFGAIVRRLTTGDKSR